MKMNTMELVDEITDKYKKRGEKPSIYLKGLVHSKPEGYWDHTNVDILLTLQNPKTTCKDEEVYIIYHQVAELVLKSMINEIKQLYYQPFSEKMWIEKVDRLIRYCSILISSEEVLSSGLEKGEYTKFCASFYPASGFQSAQLRLIEVYCTSLDNLILERYADEIRLDSSAVNYFKYIYWRHQEIDEAGKPSVRLMEFEDRYLGRIIALANRSKGKTLEDKILNQRNCSEELKSKLRQFDELYTNTWGQFQANSSAQNSEYSPRKFFPTL